MTTSLDQAGRTLPNTADSGCDAIQQQLQVYKKDYDRLTSGLAEASTDLHTTLTTWNTFDESYQQLAAWLDDTQLKLNTDTHSTDLADKKLQHNKAKVTDIYLHWGE